MKSVSLNHKYLRSAPFRSVVAAAVLLGIGLFVAGCGSSGGPSVNEQLKELGTPQVQTVKFAGTVTIDGKPPAASIKQGLRIMLYDPAKPPAPEAAPVNAMVDRDTGRFEFSTYRQGDGVPQGSYIVLFVALEHAPLGGMRGHHEPDGLNNLYNDPDKNKDNEKFKVVVAPPGRTDYTFDLELAGKEPVTTPDSKAITRF
jgi:hypothetical protein